MKTIFLFFLSLFLLGSTSMFSQVNIGNLNDPHAGAILDLSQGSSDLGLLLPHIELKDVAVFQVVPEMAADIATQKLSAKGMIIYNTLSSTTGGNGAGLYIWDGGKWRTLAIDGGSMALTPATVPPVNEAGGTVNITVSSPGAAGFSGDYTFVVVSGADYASVSPAAASDGQFSITFQSNNSAVARKAVVLVTDPAGKTATFFFSQDANSSLCANSGTHDPAVTKTGDLGTSGAVYCSVAAESGVNYVWTLNGVEVATGTTYMATAPGNYAVHGGAIGCTYQSAFQLAAPTQTAPDPVSSVVSSNGGVICGAAGTVKLTALGVPTGGNLELVWFKDGVLTGETGSSIEVDQAGNYFVVVKNGNLYSRPSNTSTVVSGGGAGKVALDEKDVKVNGTPITGFNSFCKGSSLYLTVDNQQAGVTYTWYNGNNVITNTNPYIVPDNQNSIMLRLVATDNSGALCPAETNHVENNISSVAPVVATLLGDSWVCSGQTVRLTASGADQAASFEWFKDGSLLPNTGANNYLEVSSAGSYTVRYSQSGGCMSNLSAPFVVNVQGAPVIDWDQFVTQVNTTSTYTFSVKSTGSSVPAAYTWSFTATGTMGIVEDLTQVTGNSALLTFTGDGTLTLTVSPSNNCGPGSSITKTIATINQDLDPVVISPNSGSYCNAVNFTLSKPASWTPAQWAAFKATNITATLAGNSYSGTLTSDGTDYYYAIKASANGQTATITVGGTIGAQKVQDASATVTLSQSTESSFNVSGDDCFDVLRTGSTTGRVQADFSQAYTYKLSGKLGSGATITNVTWTYTNPNNAVQVFTPAASSTTLTSNQVTVKFDPALLSDATITATGIQVLITATVTTTSSGCANANYTVTFPVTIHDADCCSSLRDADGNVYTAQKMKDGKCWQTQSMYTTKNSSGSAWTSSAKMNQGKSLSTQALAINSPSDLASGTVSYTENGSSKNDTRLDFAGKFGLLYTWDQAKTVCPSGWHLPSSQEYDNLATAYGGASNCGAQLKANNYGYAANDDQISHTWGGTNPGGFNALPAGYVNTTGYSTVFANSVAFWTSDSKNYILSYKNATLSSLSSDKTYGFSVRCVKN